MSSGQTSPLPPKKEVFLALLEGPSVFIHLDPRRQGVVVPAGFQRQPQLVLQVGRHMAVAIPGRVHSSSIHARSREAMRSTRASAMRQSRR